MKVATNPVAQPLKKAAKAAKAVVADTAVKTAKAVAAPVMKAQAHVGKLNLKA